MEFFNNHLEHVQSEFWPKRRNKEKLAERTLVQEEVADPFFAACSYEYIGKGLLQQQQVLELLGKFTIPFFLSQKFRWRWAG